jgi:hypothetical protein
MMNYVTREAPYFGGRTTASRNPPPKLIDNRAPALQRSRATAAQAEGADLGNVLVVLACWRLRFGLCAGREAPCIDTAGTRPGPRSRRPVRSRQRQAERGPAPTPGI